VIGQRKAVLIADDSDEDREFIIEALHHVDPEIDVHEVRDGVELLEYLRAPSPSRPFPDLVLLDLKMPRMDGFEALAQIRHDPSLSYVPVIAVFTTATDPEFVRRAYATGANAFIGKPSSVARMRELMSTIVEYWFDAAVLPAPPAGGLVEPP
jgi:CheY-like chemotaxis protein